MDEVKENSEKENSKENDSADAGKEDDKKQEDAELTESSMQENNSEKSEEKPEEVKSEKSEKKSKEGSWTPFVIVMILSFVILFAWTRVPALKNAVHAVLDPTAGALLNWDLTAGMLVIVFVISFVVNVIQKYATDQKALKELKKEQKILQEEMKKYREHPDKMAELSKKQFEFFPKTFKLTSRAIMFTGVPFILFFRWFNDVFTAMGDPKFFGFLSWFWFYLIFTMIFSMILRKWMKVV